MKKEENMGFILKLGSHIVVKKEDIKNSLTDDEQKQFRLLCEKVFEHREKVGKIRYPKYYIVNGDEPYANDILEIIKENEQEEMIYLSAEGDRDGDV